MITKDLILGLLAQGILAPSADNLQPWKFRIEHETVQLFLDQNRIENFCDVGNFAPYVSAGAVIENLRVAASYHGYQIETRYFPEPENGLYVAKLSFRKTEHISSIHCPALSLRMTNRNLYDQRKKIDPTILERFSHLISERTGFRLAWMERSNRLYGQLVRLVGRADQIRFENRRLHGDFFQVLRLNTQEVKQSRDGLDVATLGAGPLATLLFRFIRSWRRLEMMNVFGFSRLLNIFAKIQMHSSQAAGLLIAPNQEPISYVWGGELMQRLWHEMTSYGMVLQPMEAIPIFITHLQV